MSLPRPAAWAPAAWALASMLLVVNAWPSLATTVDDAWISARYAAQLVAGNGLAYNAGEVPVEGFTNLLWTLWLAAGLWLGVEPQPWMVGSGLAFAILTLGATLALAFTLSSRPSPALALAPLGVAASPQLAIAATNGLETALWLATLTAGCALALSRRDELRLPAAALCALLPAVRPEGAAVAGLLVAADLVARRRTLRDPGSWTLALGWGAGLLALLGWRYLTYGALVPNTFAAKASLGWRQLLATNGRYVLYDGATWPLVCLFLAALPLLPAAPAAKWARAVAVAAIAGLLALYAQVELWMPGARLLLPAWIFAWCGLAALVADDPRRPWRLACAAAGAAATLVLLAGDTHTFARQYDRAHSVLPGNGAERAAIHLSRHALPGAVLATRDAGVLAFHVGPDVRVAELHHRALTRPHPAGRDADLESYVPENPEFIATTLQALDQAASPYPNDQWLLERITRPYDYLGRVEQHFRRYYDVYARSDLDVPPLPPEMPVTWPPDPARAVPGQ